MRTILCILAGLAAVAVLGAASPRASASVMDYHTFVQSYGDTLVQYNFDGSTDAQRCEDKKGSNNLVQMIATTYDLSGFDASSRAVAGGFFTSSALNLPTTVSFEAIISPAAVSDLGYLAASFNGTNRGYFGLATDRDTARDRLAAAAGTSLSNQAVIVDPYVADDWYYFAVTMAYDSGTGKTTINTYVANLSDGDTSLAHTSTNVAVTGGFQTPGLAYGIGLINNQGTSAETPFAGTIDEIAFYGAVMDQAFFQANLDRILAAPGLVVPEPSSMLLLLSAVGILGLTIRRHR